MLDIKRIREETDAVKKAVADKGDDANIDEILRLDARRREIIPERDERKATQNRVSKEIGQRKKAGEDADELIQEMSAAKQAVKDLDEEEANVTAERDRLMLYVPNVPLDSVPEGKDASDNPEIRVWGDKPNFDFAPKEHWELGAELDILDADRSAKLSGSGFSLLKGLGARLQHGLIQFMLDLHTREHGYREVFPPFLATRPTVQNTGQLPKFEASDMYRIESDDLFLVTTAEVPLTSIHAGETLTEDDLPIRYTGYTACFRREAGAAGKETRGMARLHQFEKVELFQLVKQEDSEATLETLTANAETILQKLGLHYRTIALCRGDLGFSSAKTYDIEVWAPARNGGEGEYLEVSSCSTFTDFQTRRANIRYRPADGGKPVFCHTLNGSGVALPRLLIALLETYQQADGSVLIPEAVRPFMGGVERITAPAS